MADHDLNSLRVAERLAPILAAVGVWPDMIEDLPKETWRLAVAVYVANQRNMHHPDYVPDPAKRWNPPWDYQPSGKTRRFVEALLRPTPTPDPTADPFAGIGYRS
jgi:hypothetical protein